MKDVNHKRNAVRFTAMVFWICVVGLFYTAFVNFNNAHALSWFTWLLYIVVAVVTIYVAVVLTSKYWNIK